MHPLFSALEKPYSIKERQFKSGFGLNQKNFENLLLHFEPIWAQKKSDDIASRWQKRERKIKPGSGLDCKLPSAAICLGFTLYYLKQYPTFDALGLLFNMTGGRANILLHKHRDTLYEALKKMNVLPKNSFDNAEEFQVFLKANKMDEILVDATERPIQRPQNEERQKAHYSGKKKGTLSKIQF
jgi:hypothetical protein